MSGEMERVCQTCGKTFEVIPSIVKRGGGKFCSKACSVASQKKQIEKICNHFTNITFLKGVFKVVKFTVYGRPLPAVRMTQRGKFVKAQAGRYLAYKNQIGWAAKAAKAKKIDGPVEVNAIAYIHGNRDGDVDNLAKSFLDGLNGICWNDDKQVVKLTVEKRKVTTKEAERAEIEVREVK
jgi:crossover junction endodeoxyribonuclease RusA